MEEEIVDVSGGPVATTSRTESFRSCAFVNDVGYPDASTFARLMSSPGSKDTRISVRFASVEDAERVESLRRALSMRMTEPMRRDGARGRRASSRRAACSPGEVFFPAAPWGDELTTVVADVDGELAGAACFDRITRTRDAHVALVVAATPLERTIGRRLVEALALLAHASGIEHLIADLLTAGAPMLAYCSRAGFPTDIGVGDGIKHMRFAVDPGLRIEGSSMVRAVPVWDSTVSLRLLDPSVEVAS